MKLKILALILIVSILAFTGFYYFVWQKQKSGAPANQEGREETLAEKQLKELDELRQKMGVQPLTEKEKQAQIKELEALRKKQIQKPAQDGRGSLNEIERQLEELEKLRLAR